MRICVVGGGKVGYYLAKTLLEHGHEPVVIESNTETAARVSNGLDVRVFLGDGANLDVLREAEVETCPVMVCVSGKDEVNLVAAQLAKRIFGVRKTIARVNNPKNTAALKKLGVDIVVSATHNIAKLLEREVETTAVRQLLGLGHGAASLVEVTLPATFRYEGETLTDIPVPKGCVIISITRKDSFIIPNGTTQIHAGDRLMIAANEEALHKLVRNWRIGDDRTR